MIKNADITERLQKLIGKELSSVNLHEAIFCEDKHQKMMSRYHKGKYTYLEYKIKSIENSTEPAFVDITIIGNPNTFRMGIVEREGQIFLNSDARISYSYL
jgi:hypothetical protein